MTTDSQKELSIPLLWCEWIITNQDEGCHQLLQNSSMNVMPMHTHHMD